MDIQAKYAIANESDKMVTGLGAKGTNAYTSNEKTVYINDIPSNQIEKWLKLEAERFRNPVFRLFHTELEAVYEEKNISLGNDGNKMFHSLMDGLFPIHQYGQQTTIGTVEHLKNPSLTEIRKYFDKYYVPNNMAICLSRICIILTIKILARPFFLDPIYFFLSNLSLREICALNSLNPNALNTYNTKSITFLNSSFTFDFLGRDKKDLE